jgi:ribonuclease HII
VQAREIDPGERKRLNKMSLIERRLYKQGYFQIAGIDEAGRGPLAGPVVAAACVLPPKFLLPRLNDSKLLTPEVREELFSLLTSNFHVFYGVGIVLPDRIDAINILRATFEAMQNAVRNLPYPPDYLLIDGNQLPAFDYPHEGVVQGDAFSVSIAAASIIAKVTRDHIMDQEAIKWPEYGFEHHKGYGTEQHLAALSQFGPCPIHRKTYEPVRLVMSPDLFDIPKQHEKLGI